MKRLGREFVNDVTIVCDMRHAYNLSCRNCIHKGKNCDALKNHFKVKKPYELLDLNEQKGNYYD